MIESNVIAQFTDSYFSKSKEAAIKGGRNPVVVWQVFQKHEAYFAGYPLVAPLFDKALSVHVVPEGTKLHPWEPALIIKGYFQDLVEAETVYLGILARCTMVATNVRNTVAVANGKPVLFFPARFDVPEAEFYDGYAAYIGGAAGCATAEQTRGFAQAAWNQHQKTAKFMPVGTMPHALIAAFDGNTAEAALAFAKARPTEDVWALVDFDNDCAKTALSVLETFRANGIENRLAGVRLDTSEKLADKGIVDKAKEWRVECPTGVCLPLVKHVRDTLNTAGARQVKIAVSGGFTTEKIAMFEQAGAPVDVYAVGERFIRGGNAFTSDIVARFDNDHLIACGKVGRELKTNGNLELVQTREGVDALFANASKR